MRCQKGLLFKLFILCLHKIFTCILQVNLALCFSQSFKTLTGKNGKCPGFCAAMVWCPRCIGNYLTNDLVRNCFAGNKLLWKNGSPVFNKLIEKSCCLHSSV